MGEPRSRRTSFRPMLPQVRSPPSRLRFGKIRFDARLARWRPCQETPILAGLGRFNHCQVKTAVERGSLPFGIVAKLESPCHMRTNRAHQLKNCRFSSQDWRVRVVPDRLRRSAMSFATVPIWDIGERHPCRAMTEVQRGRNSGPKNAEPTQGCRIGDRPHLAGYAADRAIRSRRKRPTNSRAPRQAIRRSERCCRDPYPPKSSAAESWMSIACASGRRAERDRSGVRFPQILRSENARDSFSFRPERPSRFGAAGFANVGKTAPIARHACNEGILI